MRACPQCLSVFASDPEYCSFDGTRTSGADGSDPLAGEKLLGYRFDAQLGVGGTGCVYHGTILATGRPCAIKLLFGEMATDRSIAARFRREVDAVSRIAHQNVVRIFDFGTTAAGLTYLVMEYLDGRTLKTIIEEEAPLTPDRAGRIAEQLTAGLAEAHRLGYVHRDLKPGNIIVQRSSKGVEKVKILDFGIVASIHERQSEERLTKTGYIVGTPTYMAPEQIDPKAVSPQADVYALGVILYEMLSGEPPFMGTLEQILVAKMTRKAAPLEGAGELGELVMRMLEMNPERRPPSALHVSAELSRTSLLTEDPKTIRGPMPDLPPLHEVGFAPTVQVFDRTDEQAVVSIDERNSSGEQWVPTTSPHGQAPDSDHLEFRDEAPTTATPKRYDTVRDGRGSIDAHAFDGLPEIATPTHPELGASIPEVDDHASADLPTTVSYMPNGFEPTEPKPKEPIAFDSGPSEPDDDGETMEAQASDLRDPEGLSRTTEEESPDTTIPLGVSDLDSDSLEAPTPLMPGDFADESKTDLDLTDMTFPANAVVPMPMVHERDDGDTALSFLHVEPPQIYELQSARTRPRVREEPRTRAAPPPSAPPGMARRSRWTIGLLMAAAFFAAAAAAYAVLEPGNKVVIEAPQNTAP